MFWISLVLESKLTVNLQDEVSLQITACSVQEGNHFFWDPWGYSTKNKDNVGAFEQLTGMPTPDLVWMQVWFRLQ